MTMTARVMQQYGPYMMRDRGGHPWLALALLVLGAAAVGLLIWLLVRNSHTAGHYPYAPPFAPPPPTTVDPALDTLRMRFARGEIDADEYASRVALLSGGPPPAPSGPPGS